jgi:hypothetical protein
MRKAAAIDFGKLLGFASVTGTLPGNVDFRDANLGARLGAKVGDKTWAACAFDDAPCSSEMTDPNAKRPRSEATEA